MAQEKAKILIVQLGDSMQVSLFDDLYSSLQKKLEASYKLAKTTTPTSIIDHLSQPSPQLKAVLIVDGGLSKQKFKKTQLKLASYAKNGGMVIFCCNFSSFVTGPDFIALANNMGVEWEWGDYHRTTFNLSPVAKTIFQPEAYETLRKSYSMKAVHLKEVDADAKIYVPTNESRTQSLVFAPTQVDKTQCPALLQKHGQGFMGYIGDVNNETGSQALLMAMLGITTNAVPIVSQVQAEPSSASGKGGCAVCGVKTPVKKCVGCKQAQYCSVECQRADWKDHRPECRSN